MFGGLFGSGPKHEFKPRRFRQTLTVILSNGDSHQKIIEAEDHDTGLGMLSGSELLKQKRISFLDRVGHSGFQIGATFIPAWRIDRVEVGAVEDVE